MNPAQVVCTRKKDTKLFRVAGIVAAMGTALEQCVTTIDRAVMSGAEVRPPETD